ncbi:hypothetical protein ACWDNI_35765 [Nocardia niigatensis]
MPDRDICQIALGNGNLGEPWDPPDCLCRDCREDAEAMAHIDEEMARGD